MGKGRQEKRVEIKKKKKKKRVNKKSINEIRDMTIFPTDNKIVSNVIETTLINVRQLYEAIKTTAITMITLTINVYMILFNS